MSGNLDNCKQHKRHRREIKRSIDKTVLRLADIIEALEELQLDEPENYFLAKRAFESLSRLSDQFKP